METTPGKRVQIFREYKGYKTASAFAEAAGLKVATLSSIETDRTSPSFDSLALLTAAFPDLSIDWLLTGNGPMLRDGRALAPKPEPFFPGSTTNQHGAGVLPKGGLAAQLGKNFGEDVDGAHAKELPKDRQAFIQMLLQEIEALKESNGHLQVVINEQREALKESRENARYLREQNQHLTAIAKDEGSQYAPVTYAAEPQSAIGFGRVRQMWPALHGKCEMLAA